MIEKAIKSDEKFLDPRLPATFMINVVERYNLMPSPNDFINLSKSAQPHVAQPHVAQPHVEQEMLVAQGMLFSAGLMPKNASTASPFSLALACFIARVPCRAQADTDLLVSQMVSTIPAEFRTQYMNQRVKGWEVFICTISNMLKRKGVKITKQKDRSAHQGVPPFMLKIQAILIACNHHLKECNDWFDSSPLIMNDKIVIYRKSRSCVAQSTAERIINVYNEEKMRNSYTTIMELKESMETIARIAQMNGKPRGVETWKNMTPEDEEPTQISTERDRAPVLQGNLGSVSNAPGSFKASVSTQEGTHEASSLTNVPTSSSNQAPAPSQAQTAPQPNLPDTGSNTSELPNSAKTSTSEISGASAETQSPDDVPGPDSVPPRSSDCVRSPVPRRNDRFPVPPPPRRRRTTDELEAFYAARNQEYEQHKRNTGYESSSSEDDWIERGHTRRSRRNGRQNSNERDVVEQQTTSNQMGSYAEIDAQDNLIDPVRHLEDFEVEVPANWGTRADKNEGPDQQIESGRAEGDDSDEEDGESDAETFEAVTSNSPQKDNHGASSLVNRPVSESHQTSACGQIESDSDPSNATEASNSATRSTVEISKASTQGPYDDVPGPDLVSTRSPDCVQSPVPRRNDHFPVPPPSRRNQTADELNTFYKARNQEYEQRKTTTGYESSSSEDDCIETEVIDPALHLEDIGEEDAANWGTRAVQNKGPDQHIESWRAEDDDSGEVDEEDENGRRTQYEGGIVEQSEVNNEIEAYSEIDAPDNIDEPARHLEDVEEEVPVDCVTRADQNEEANRQIELGNAEDDDLDEVDEDDGESDADIPTMSRPEETRKRPATMGLSRSPEAKKPTGENNYQDKEIKKALESVKPKRKRKSQRNYFSSKKRKRHQAASQRYKLIKETESQSSTSVASSSIQDKDPAAHPHGEVQLQVPAQLALVAGHLENEEDDLLASGPIVLLSAGSSQEIPPQGMRYRQSRSSPSVPFGVQRAGQHGINNGALERNFRDYPTGENAAGPSTSAQSRSDYSDRNSSHRRSGIGYEYARLVFPVDEPAANFTGIGATDQI
ncbi:hypothetical protein B9Z55_022447 [Caenorhabditis nigoni]|nr:hypothetical protein B9Z55_022447 [Caenorhabditis nigoni]